MNIPILMNNTGRNEIATPQSFATHVPDAFKNAEDVKRKYIHRAYIIFYDSPNNNTFLKKLNVVFDFHAGSATTYL